MIIYLAGGMKTDWRRFVRDAVPHHVYLSPADHQLTEPRHYKAWDLAAIRTSDVLFGYFAADNPSGFGLAVELGYAKGKDKLVILADEKSAADAELERYIAFLRVTADVTFDALADAIAYLRTLPGGHSW